MTGTLTRSHVEFRNDYDRRNLRGMRGSVEERAHLFSHWDGVPPQRPLRAASRPHHVKQGSTTYTLRFRSISEYERNVKQSATSIAGPSDRIPVSRPLPVPAH